MAALYNGVVGWPWRTTIHDTFGKARRKTSFWLQAGDGTEGHVHVGWALHHKVILPSFKASIRFYCTGMPGVMPGCSCACVHRATDQKTKTWYRNLQRLHHASAKDLPLHRFMASPQFPAVEGTFQIQTGVIKLTTSLTVLATLRVGDKWRKYY